MRVREHAPDAPEIVVSGFAFVCRKRRQLGDDLSVQVEKLIAREAEQFGQ